MRQIHLFRSICLLLLMGCLISGVQAQQADVQEESEQINPAQAELERAFQALDKALIKGPNVIPFAGRATLSLPADFGFVPAQQTRDLLAAMGNKSSADTLGMIVPLGDNFDWFMVATYQDAGYIKDDDAANWNADELLDSIREGTSDMNQERTARGLPELEIVGWIEKPLYNPQSHQLVWSIESRSVGQADDVSGINYNTLALGREGYISMNLVTDTRRVEALKPVAQSLLAALKFDDGKRYADFNSSTDKVAEYGLAALVAGVAAKKLGLIAMATAFLIKSWKLAALALLGGGSFFRKLFKRKDQA